MTREASDAPRFSSGTALIAAGAFLTYPGFFGQAFSGREDALLPLFSSLALMSYYAWRMKRRLPFLYGYYLGLGLALAVDACALYVPVILLLWRVWTNVAEGSPLEPEPEESAAHHAAGLLLTAAALLALHASALRGGGLPAEIGAWLTRNAVRAGAVEYWGRYSLERIFGRTPLPMLLAACCGFSLTLARKPLKPGSRFILLWLLVPVFPPCLPGFTSDQTGPRLFLMTLAPFSILAALGVEEAARLLARRLGADRRMLAAALGAVMLGSSALDLATTHPYETAFVNSLARDARSDFPDPFDPAASYREGGRWLNARAEPNATVYAVQDAPWKSALLRASVARPDLRLRYVDSIDALAADGPLPNGSYVLTALDFLKNSRDYELVDRVERQGRRILSIYKKRAPDDPPHDE